jgi:hypothetical protein
MGAGLDVALEHHEITVAGPLGRAGRLRIGFASDFHAGPNTPSQMIRNALERLSAAQPDVVLLGGDYVSLQAEYLFELIPLFAALRPPLGCCAVLGNHDYWADADMIRTALRTAGIRVLHNECVALPDPFANVTVCAIDDHTSGAPDADAAFRGSGGVRVLLMHGPSSLLDVGERDFDVALCGHTHGGQIATTSGRPIVVAHGALSRRYNAGRYMLDAGGTLLVSRGVGFGGVLPLRYNAPAAVMVCTVVGQP